MSGHVAMKHKKIINLTSGNVLADRARVADSFASRFVGLLFSPPLAPGQGLLIKPCSAIHMIGMKYAIDAVFLDRDWRVVGLADRLAPWRFSPVYRKSRTCLELPAGTITNTATKLGDQIELRDCSADLTD
jgi:uncharacterized membrane protein (UPF0127 family)